MVEFLCASLALFDDEPAPATATLYRPCPLELYDVTYVRDRIRQRLIETPDGGPLDRFLPEPSDRAESEPVARLRCRSAWSSTLVASLDLAKQGELMMEQAVLLQIIHVASVAGLVDDKDRHPAENA